MAIRLYTVAAMASVLAHATTPPTPPAKAYEATFDDLENPSPIIGGGRLVNIYKEIDWVGLGLTTAGSGVSQVTGTQPVGVVPHSKFQAGDWGLYSVTPNKANMVTDYPNSRVKSFDLQDFWFGCIVNSAETTGDVPSKCTVTVSGFYAGTHNPVTPPATFDFDPGLLKLSAPMVYAKLPAGFTKLENVTYQITAPELVGIVLAGSMDNVRYTVRYI